NVCEEGKEIAPVKAGRHARFLIYDFRSAIFTNCRNISILSGVRCLNSLVPEGLLTIARRFNAGNQAVVIQVPKRRLEFFSVVPSGLEPFPFRTRQYTAGLFSTVPSEPNASSAIAQKIEMP